MTTYRVVTSDPTWAGEETHDFYWAKEAYREAEKVDPNASVVDVETGDVVFGPVDDPEPEDRPIVGMGTSDPLDVLRAEHEAGEHMDTRRGDCPTCEEAFGDPIARALQQVADLTEATRDAVARNVRLHAERTDAIRWAVKVGASQGKVAEAAGITRQRVQQLADLSAERDLEKEAER